MDLIEALGGGVGPGEMEMMDMPGEFEQVDDLMAEEGQPGEGSGDDEPGVDMETLRSILKQSIEEAVNYAEEELARPREIAQEMYDGSPLPGDDCLEKTRSRFISRDVHDVVKAILPDLLRIFFSGKSMVEFMPNGPEDEGWAQQATEYVNQIVLGKDNNGFEVFYAIFWDALCKGLGTVMWYWEGNYKVTGQQYTGLTEMEMAALIQNEFVTDVIVTNQYIPAELGIPLTDCHVTYRIPADGKLIVEAVPPEERLINKAARNIDGSSLYGRRRTMTVSEMVAMGYSFDQIKSMTGPDALETNEEAVERYDSQTQSTEATTADPSMRTLEYYEVFLRVDLDGDGFAELCKIGCAGPSFEILELAETGELAIETVDEIPYAEFCPSPVPHAATGDSVSESIEDVQTVKSNLIRGALDSLSRAIFPREEVVANQVNMEDVLNPEIGAIIRTKAPGMIREIITPFMGKEAMPMVSYMDEVKADRTGVSEMSSGLDPQALQSTTAAGVSAAVSGAQAQIELIARIFARIGMVRTFNGILKVIKTHQDKVRTVRLRNEWVDVDPTMWNAQMDATVNTALGRGTEAERMAALRMISEKQERILETMGPTNPLVTTAEYRNTLAEMIELAGYPNADRFVLPVTHQQVMQQLMQEKQQITQQMQEMQQQVAVLSFELQGHTQSEDLQKQADALNKKAQAIEKLVNAAQTAQEIEVGPAAMDDEMTAAGKYMN